MKKFIIIISIAIFFSLITGGIYYLFKKPPEQNLPENQTVHTPCLGDNETAIFQYYGPRVTATSADIVIKNKNTEKELFRFRVDNLSPNHSHPYEFRKCGIYVVKEFNWDVKRSKPLPGFSEELWKYTYDGQGKQFLVFGEDDGSGKVHIFYEIDFRTDFLETYIALITGYLEEIDEYATVIKEISTKNDVFSLGYQDIINRHPDLIGFLALGGWTKDSRYFWGHLQVGASVTAFFRIKVNTWKTEVLPVPEQASTVSTISKNGEYIIYDNGPGWIGIHEHAQQIYKEWRRKDKKVSLFLYNLFTKQKIKLATTDDPSWSFEPKWLSDTELEYYLPSGERKVYKIDGK